MTEFGDEIKRLREADEDAFEERAYEVGWEPWEVQDFLDRMESDADPDFYDVVILSKFSDADLAHLLRLSGCELPPGLALVEESESDVARAIAETFGDDDEQEPQP